VEHKALLIALLNHMLELVDERRIVDVQHLSSEQHVGILELKLSIVDVKCTDASGRRFVVEMQVLKVEGFGTQLGTQLLDNDAFEARLHRSEVDRAPSDARGATGAADRKRPACQTLLVQ
jgi:hypothetical protein